MLLGYTSLIEFWLRWVPLSLICGSPRQSRFAMPAAVPLRRDLDAAGLRRLALRCSDNRPIRRLPALAAVCDGMNRTEAGAAWRNGPPDIGGPVHRFDKEGPDGLTNQRGCRPPLAVERPADAGTGADCRNRAGRAMVWCAGGASIRFGSSMNVSAWHGSQSVVSNCPVEPGFSHIPGRPRHPTRHSRVIGAFKEPCQRAGSA